MIIYVNIWNACMPNMLLTIVIQQTLPTTHNMLWHCNRCPQKKKFPKVYHQKVRMTVRNHRHAKKHWGKSRVIKHYGRSHSRVRKRERRNGRRRKRSSSSSSSSTLSGSSVEKWRGSWSRSK